MKLISLKCPGCGASLQVDTSRTTAVCPYCHTQFLIDDEVRKLQLDNPRNTGYEFEKGRQDAQRESVQISAEEAKKKKRKTIILIVLWILLFPLMATIALWRSSFPKSKFLKIILTLILCSDCPSCQHKV